MNRTFALMLVAGLGIAAGLTAGPLTPPAGAPGSTYKTLGEVEPRRSVQSLASDVSAQYVIGAPGSYYLTGSILGVTGKSAIRIDAPNVSLDLSGFTVQSAGAAGILVSPGYKFNIQIRNGAVVGSAWSGVDAAYAPNARLEGLRLESNQESGLWAGPHSVIQSCEATANLGHGIFAYDRAVVSDCVANNNFLNGFALGESSTVTHCTATYNASGLDVLSFSAISGCVANHNNVYGIRVHSNTTVSQCTAGVNNAEGFFADEANTITGCTSNENITFGFNVNHSTTVTGCTARKNKLDGIVATQACRITGNTCNSNGWNGGPGAGIRVTASYNYIEGNALHANTYGVQASGQNNTIVRNVFTANGGDANVAANNGLSNILTVTPGFNSWEGWANLKR